MRLMLLVASMQSQSVNRRLLNHAYHYFADKHSNIELDWVELKDYDLPLYDADIEKQRGLPTAALEFVERVEQAHGIVIASPEYNHSTPAPLKNLIDWVSRQTPSAWYRHSILLMSASPASAGGNRGLWQTRIPLEACGAFVFPEMFSLSNAWEMLPESNSELPDQSQQNLHKLLSEFVEWA